MMTYRTFKWALCGVAASIGLAALAAPATRPASPAPARPARLDDFSVLWEHNIFLKNRRPPRIYTPQTSRGSENGGGFSRRRPEQQWALTGVFSQEGHFVAFLENSTTFETSKLAVGDPILQGKIAEVGIDYMEYDVAGKRTRVEIGHNLVGEATVTATANTYISATTHPAASGSASTTQPAANIPPEDPNMSMEEKLKLRRLRQLNGQ
jgi:hypothetical protein